MNLSQRLVLLVAVVLTPLIAVNAYVLLDLRQSHEVEVRAQVEQSAIRIASEEGQIIDGARQLLQTLAELNEIRDRDGAACSRLLDVIRPHFQGFEAFAVTDATGSVFCVTTLAVPAP